jgi:methanol metabolism-related c-type cytochrome
MVKSGRQCVRGASLTAALVFCAVATAEQRKGDDGMYVDSAGNPTYRVSGDGTVDWFTYEGFRRYSAACLHCHGPDGLGSTFAPAMTGSLKTLSYQDFVRIVVEGSTSTGASGPSVMPPFGQDPNIRCHIDAIYIYLKARSDDAIPRGRPPKKEPQTAAAQAAENACSQS